MSEPTISTEARSPATWERIARYVARALIALTGLVVLALPMLVIAVLIRCSSPGPALYRQRRVGIGGKLFTVYKFRTMKVDASDLAHRQLVAQELRGEHTAVNGSFKLHADPRVTKVGSWLRRTSVDELPQLINVLRGEMALVGPRPCLEWEAQLFPAEFADRFAVRPGITGLWQVSGRSKMGTLDMLRLDVVYARSRSIPKDLGILLRTLPAVLRRDGAR
jgi:lipopolysaccharide/colanic/teichoic acid biosynthesis glycosyltransferase